MSAVAVLHITDIGDFPGHKRWAKLEESVDNFVSKMPRVCLDMLRRCARTVSEPVQREWVRVPLDVQRTGMRSLQWSPTWIKLNSPRLCDHNTE